MKFHITSEVKDIRIRHDFFTRDMRLRITSQVWTADANNLTHPRDSSTWYLYSTTCVIFDDMTPSHETWHIWTPRKSNRRRRRRLTNVPHKSTPFLRSRQNHIKKVFSFKTPRKSEPQTPTKSEKCPTWDMTHLHVTRTWKRTNLYIWFGVTWLTEDIIYVTWHITWLTEDIISEDIIYVFCETCLMCNVTCMMSSDSFIYVIWCHRRHHICNMTHHMTLSYETWHTDVTHLHETWLNSLRHDSFTRDMTYRHDSLTWDMTHSLETWLLHSSPDI